MNMDSINKKDDSFSFKLSKLLNGIKDYFEDPFMMVIKFVTIY